MGEPGSEADLLAYVDGELPLAERIAFEARLGREPELAALLLEDLRLRDELRQFLAEGAPAGAAAWPAPARSVALARELARRLRRPAMAERLRRGLLAASLVALGWFAHQGLGPMVEQVAAAHPPPAFAEAAAEAFATLRLRAEAGEGAAPGAPEMPRGGDVGPVPLPALGPELRLVGSTLVPWSGGAALVAVHRTAAGGLVTLFAAEAASFAVTAPQLVPLAGEPAVQWQDGSFVYALNGSLPAGELLTIARHAAARPAAPGGQASSTGGNHG
ncbi:MAG: hypothetical protein U1E17_18655 [Geminicoccaceae bacterium]